MMKKIKLFFLYMKSWFMSFFDRREKVALEVHKKCDDEGLKEVVHKEKKKWGPGALKHRMKHTYGFWEFEDDE